MTISQFKIKYFVCKQASVKMLQVLSEVKEEPQLGFNTENYKTENKRFL